jgi:hypothetical protein
MTEEAPRHATSLAVWDIPAAAAAGERFTVKAGAKSSAGSALSGKRIEVCDGAGAVLGSARLGETPWPGTTALFWAEISLNAPQSPGPVTLTASFDAAAIDEPHDGASSPFNVTVVAQAEHTLTVKVSADGTALDDAVVRLGPYRAPTDGTGIARVRLASGRYELVVWKTGYEMTSTPIAVDADASVDVTTQRLPEDHPDSVWTA